MIYLLVSVIPVSKSIVARPGLLEQLVDAPVREAVVDEDLLLGVSAHSASRTPGHHHNRVKNFHLLYFFLLKIHFFSPHIDKNIELT